MSRSRFDRCCRWLLRLYPKAFRRRFGDGLKYALQKEWERTRGHGRAAVALFWLTTLADAIYFGSLERFWRLRHPRRRPGVGEETMKEALRELLLAVRRLLRSPSFSLTTVMTLGLGLGAATAIFSVVNTVVLRPLPYAEPERLVMLAHGKPDSQLGMPDGGYFEYSRSSETLEKVAVYIESTTQMSGSGEPVELGVIQATPSLLEVLGVEPVLGRNFSREEAERGADPVVIVSHQFWMNRLGGDPQIVGKPVMEGSRQRVVGVLPEDFSFIRPQATIVFGTPFTTPDVLVPLRLDESRARFGNFMYQGIARLAAGVGAAEAAVELTGLMRRAVVNYPGRGNLAGYTLTMLEDEQLRPQVVPLKQAIVGEVGRVLWILMGAVGFVLLIAAVNALNLFLVRAESMRREMAVRRALGAGRAVLLRWYLSEGMVLAVLGGMVAVAMTAIAGGTLLRLVPDDVPRLEQVAVDGGVVVFAFSISVLVGIIFGAVPLLRCRGERLPAAMGDDNRSATHGRRSRRLGQALVATQVAFALVLLVGSGLLLQTFESLRRVDAGFGGHDALTLRLSLPGREFPADWDRTRFMLRLTERLQALPGIDQAAFTADLPLDGNEFADAVAIRQAVPPAGTTAPTALRVFMGPGYLQAIGARMAAGRELDRLDFAGDFPRAVVVNESFARQRWPGEDPIGQQIAQWYEGQSADRDIWYTVVGVVEDIRERSLMSPPEPTVYLPTVFLPDSDFVMFVRGLTVVLPTSTPDALQLFERVRAEIRAVHREIPIDAVQTLVGLKAASMRQVTFAMIVLLVATAVSICLGLVGIYGIVAYFVGRRRREFGVRLAFGATGADLRRAVLKEGVAVASVGIALGLAAALASTRSLESLLFGVSPADPMVYAAAAGAIFVLVLLAGLVPAQRAAAVDPLQALRE